MYQYCYVYTHHRLSDGAPFYVGKGAGKRCLDYTNRNLDWTKVVLEEGGFAPKIIACNLPNQQALRLEGRLIYFLTTQGFKLANNREISIVIKDVEVDKSWELEEEYAPFVLADLRKIKKTLWV